MLQSNFVNFNTKHYFIVFFRAIFLYFNYIAFFSFLNMSSAFIFSLKMLGLKNKCGFLSINSKHINSVLKFNFLNFNSFPKIGILFSNNFLDFYNSFDFFLHNFKPLSLIYLIFFNHSINIFKQDFIHLFKS